MPAPLANRMSAIDAPVASLRHSIFSAMPTSDFSRHGMASLWIRISSSLGAPAGSIGISGASRFDLDEHVAIGPVAAIAQLVHLAAVAPDDRTGLLVGVAHGTVLEMDLV